MSVVTSIEDAGPSRKRLEIQVPGAAVEAETQRIVKDMRSQARLPGFRKGKVPVGLVKAKFADDIRQQVIDRLVPRYWHQAETESQLDALMPPTVEKVDLEDESLTFVALVEIRPEIELGNLGDYELPEMDVEPKAEEIDKAIEDLRFKSAELVPVERPAAAGDVVVAHLTEMVDGKPGPRANQPVTVEVGDPNVWEELTGAIEGLSADDDAEFVRKGSDDDPESGRTFKVHVAVVKERQLAELDDDFAAALGDFETLGELRENVEMRLRSVKLDELRSRREEAVLDQLRERHPVELPEGVVAHENEHLLRDYAESLARRGVDLESAEIDWAALQQQMRPQAEKRLHARLLLDAVVSAEGLEVTAEELEATVAGLARMEGKTPAAFRSALDSSGRLGELREQLRRRKALRHLLGEDETREQDEATSAESDAETDTPGEAEEA